MNFLPVAERELRVASRNSKTYWSRFWIGLIGGVFMGWMMFIFNAAGFGSMQASSIFYSIGFYGFIFAMSTGAGLTSDCVSSEKREGTLGLLFLTPLRGLDILVGKLISSSLSAFYSMLAIIPVLSLFLLVGGVRGGEILRLFAFLISVLFFSSVIGLACSSWFVNRKTSSLASSVLLLALYFGLPVLGKVLVFNGQPLGNLLFWISPAPIESAASLGGFRLGNPLASAGAGFWFRLAAANLEGLLLLLLAGHWLQTRWNHESPPKRRLSWKERWQRFIYGDSETRLQRRRKLLHRNPILWLMARDRRKGWSVWFLIVVTFLAGPLLWAATGFHEAVLYGVIVTAVLTWYLSPKLLAAGEAGRLLAEEKETGTIELLATTPLRVSEFIRGHWLCLRRYYLWASLIPFFLFAGAGVWFIKHPPVGGGRGELTEIGPFLAALAFLSILDTVAVSWAAIWQGLKTGDGKRAAKTACGAVLGLSWLLYFLTLSVQGVLSYYWQADLFMPLRHQLAVWTVIGIAVDVWAIWWARAHLHREFRRIASARFTQESGGAWGRWLGEWYVRRMRPRVPAASRGLLEDRG